MLLAWWDFWYTFEVKEGLTSKIYFLYTSDLCTFLNSWFLEFSHNKMVFFSFFFCFLWGFFFFFLFFWVIPAACESSQAGGLNRATAAELPAYTIATAMQDLSSVCNLHHSSGQCRNLTHWAKPGIEPKTSWFLVGFVSTAPLRELLFLCSYLNSVMLS